LLICGKWGRDKYYREIARNLKTQTKKLTPPFTCDEIANYVRKSRPNNSEEPEKQRKENSIFVSHSARRTFQALRILVNNELFELWEGLKTAEEFLTRPSPSREPGRLVIISYNNVEDMMFHCFVKATTLANPEREHLWRGILKQEPFFPSFSGLSAFRPSKSEVLQNKRSRNAKFYCLKRTSNPSLMSNTKFKNTNGTDKRQNFFIEYV